MTHFWTNVVCLVSVAVSIPLAAGWVPPNRWYGFRTPTTLSDPELWRRVNTFAGWSMLLGAVIGFIIVTLLPEIVDPWGTLVIAGLVSVATAASSVYLAIIKKNR